MQGMGGNFGGADGGAGVGLALGRSEDKQEADRRKAEYAADLQRQMQPSSHGAAGLNQVAPAGSESNVPCSPKIPR
jgi:hypothetical protein